MTLNELEDKIISTTERTITENNIQNIIQNIIQGGTLNDLYSNI
ncbi:hypothetical protein EUBVEN_02219 [Eubacterium ventriosum ATCC 27560]|uniref:Uncharacterized protein n=1 Tax=Eubacterium ventriosum ATCC 27560 TaxID=411463 RepID=A5Z926_9FIRM|nr:hypothetical protein EUBVEN_02219 [Eubacterium ventriosum ATCC 27560]